MKHLSATSSFLDKGSQVFNVKAYGAKGDGSTDDSAAILAAISAMPATGGRLYFPQGNVYTVSSRFIINGKSNFEIDGGNSTIKASGSIYGSGDEQHYGIFTFKNHTTLVKNIYIHNLTIDCNNQLKTQALTITGGDNTGGTASTSNVLLSSLMFKNMGASSADTARALLELISGNISLGNFGRIDRITIRDCEFDTSEYFHNYLLGNYITNLKVLDNYYHHNKSHTFNFVQYSYDAVLGNRSRSNRNWELSGCRFENTKLGVGAGSVADISDDNRTGILNFNIHDNYFGPKVGTLTDEIAIDLHETWGLTIRDNYFDQVAEAFSLGHSNAGNYHKVAPSKFVNIEGNTFYKVSKSTIDNDANIFTRVKNNIFYYTGDFSWGGYSVHWPTVIEDNIFYNGAVAPFGASEYNKAAIEIVGDGYVVRNNVMIDDRLLANPVTAPTLSQVAGGALSARTYYAAYTWANDTGQTLASAESTLAVSANNLLKVALPISDTYPTGAKTIKIYVGTTSGDRTLQVAMDIDGQTETGSPNWSSLEWTEPTTGLVAGAALPGSNTTQHKMLYGIYEVGGAGGPKLTNFYEGNRFYGIGTPIVTSPSYTRVTRNNWTNYAIAARSDVPLDTDSIMVLDTFRKRPVLFCDFLVNSSTNSFDPFVGSAIASGSITTANSGLITSDHPGIVKLRSSTSANSGGYIGSSSAQFLLGRDEEFECVINPTNFTNGTFRLGFHDAGGSATEPTDGAYIEVDSSGVATGKTANNSARTSTGTTYTLSTGTWYRLKIVVNSNATQVDYSIYDNAGVLLWTNSVTSNIPTASGRETGVGVVAVNSGITATDLLHLDYMAVAWASDRTR